MTTITFDTHKAVERLIKKGVKKEQAEEIVQTVQESRGFDLNNLATKEQMNLIEKDIDNITRHFATKSEMYQMEKRILIAIGTSVVATCTIILAFLQMMGKL